MYSIYFIPNQSFINILHGYKLVRLPYSDIAYWKNQSKNIHVFNFLKDVFSSKLDKQ